MKKLEFPEKFYWGAATSSHQVEGGNHNDWTEWEKKNATRLTLTSRDAFSHLPNWNNIERKATSPENYISGIACDHYHRYEEDFDIAQSLGHNAHRFSIEWSRIEPVEGKFDEKEIEHYRSVLLALRARGMEPFVTLWHWTNPVWLAEKGGPEKQDFAISFERYVRFVVSHLSDVAHFWITLNEPTAIIGASYIIGIWPPQKKNLLAAYRTLCVLANAHSRASRAIHEIASGAQVGFANSLVSFEPSHEHSLLNKLAVRVARFFTNRYFYRLTRHQHDFIAVHYYFHIRFNFPHIVHLKNRPVSDLGWEIYPKGIYNILKEAARYQKPIYITENGLADAQDVEREAFIHDHLQWVHKAIEEGADVRGYFYWSLMDNFEWDKGFWPRFGLVSIDYATQKRTIHPSALAYAKICKENAIEIE